MGLGKRNLKGGLSKILSGLKKIKIPTPGQAYEAIVKQFHLAMLAIYISPYRDPGVELEDYLEAVKSGRLYRKLWLGIADKEQGYLVMDPVTNPGLICIGGMGSGKSTTLKGVVVTLQISSGQDVFFLMIDASDKAMGDYKAFFDLPNVATALNDKQKLVPAISMASDELKARGKRFADIGSYANWLALKNGAKDVPVVKGAGEIYEYERLYKEIHEEYLGLWQKMYSKIKLSEDEKNRLLWIADKDILSRGITFCLNLKKCVNEEDDSLCPEIEIEKESKNVAFFFLVFEEFASVCNSPEIMFGENHHIEGTLAHKLKEIARTGRSFGINILIASQRATYTEIPNDLKVGVSNILAHKLGSSNDASAFNLGHAADILSTQRGRSAYEEGWVQFPYFPGASMEKLVRDFSHDFKGILFAHSAKDYKNALKGSGSDGMLEQAKLKFVALNHQMFKPVKVVKRFVELFGFEVLDDEFPSMEIDGIVTKDGIRYALMIIVPKPGRGGFSRGGGVSDKKIAHFKNEMKLVGADSVMAISFDTLPSGIENLAEKTNGYAVDKEDLVKIGEIIDQQEITKANGTFDELYKEIVFVRSEEEPQEDDVDEELDEEEEFLSNFNLD